MQNYGGRFAAELIKNSACAIYAQGKPASQNYHLRCKLRHKLHTLPRYLSCRLRSMLFEHILTCKNHIAVPFAESVIAEVGFR